MRHNFQSRSLNITFVGDKRVGTGNSKISSLQEEMSSDNGSQHVQAMGRRIFDRLMVPVFGNDVLRLLFKVVFLSTGRGYDL